jgi:RNA polymerase sigma-70 factor (ECF subfamily)
MRPTAWDGFRSPKERAGTLPNSSLPPPDPGTVEALLARALRQRDEAAFDGLLDRLHSPMLRLARVFVRSREDAEEVVQDTWLAALAGIGRFQGRSSLKTWLFRILVYRARTRGRREARTVPFSALAASAEGGAGGFRADGWPGETARPGTELFLSEAVHRTSGGPEAEFLAAELRRQVESAVEGLPVRQREVVTLRDLEGWSADEVCELLGLTEANQRVLLHRARVRVRDAIVPYMAASGAGDACCVRVSDRPPQRYVKARVGRAPGCAGVGLRLRSRRNDRLQRRRAPQTARVSPLRARIPHAGIALASAGVAALRPCPRRRASSSVRFIPGGMRSPGIAASRSIVHRIRRSCRRHSAHARRCASSSASTAGGSARSRYSVIPAATCPHLNGSCMRLISR